MQKIECKKKDNCVTVQICAAEPDGWFMCGITYRVSSKYFTLNTQYMSCSYIVFSLKIESAFQNMYHFWPKNGGKKWSRKIF